MSTPVRILASLVKCGKKRAIHGETALASVSEAHIDYINTPTRHYAHSELAGVQLEQMTLRNVRRRLHEWLVCGPLSQEL